MPDAICAARADTRSVDAADNGYSRALQAKIREHTYRDCVTWAAKSGTFGVR